MFKPRFQPEAGNAAHCGPAASLEAAALLEGIPSRRLGTRSALDNLRSHFGNGDDFLIAAELEDAFTFDIFA